MRARTAHATFVLEYTYPVEPARVFAAWAAPGRKARWFGASGDWKSGGHELDFRVGGSEHLRTVDPDSLTHVYDAFYHDIVSDRRIVYSYHMSLGGERSSVSLVTVDLAPEGEGTRLVFTEQVAFLDGKDSTASREAGTRALLDKLGRSLAAD